MTKQSPGPAPPAATPRQRLQALTPERRARLLDPAEEEFARRGYEGASLNRILAAAGMSKGQAYYYIADKSDLYAAVIDRALDRVVAKTDFDLETPTDPDDFWRRIGAFLDRVTELFVEDDRLAQLARGIYEGPSAQAALAAPLARIRTQLHRLVALGREVGAVRDDVPESLLVDAALAATRAIDRWFADHWHELSGADALHLSGRSVELIRGMCVPPAGRAREEQHRDG